MSPRYELPAVVRPNGMRQGRTWRHCEAEDVYGSDFQATARGCLTGSRLYPSEKRELHGMT